MKGDRLITMLRDAGITARAVGGRVELQPKRKVTEETQALVRQNKDEVLAELAKWPKGEAPARNYWIEPPRADELGRESVRRPRVISSRHPWRSFRNADEEAVKTERLSAELPYNSRHAFLPTHMFTHMMSQDESRSGVRNASDSDKPDSRVMLTPEARQKALAARKAKLAAGAHNRRDWAGSETWDRTIATPPPALH